MTSRPLRVMQLVLSLETGGLEKLVYDLVLRLDQYHITPIVCCLDRLGMFGEELQQKGYPIYVLKRKPGIDWSLIPQLKAIIQQEAIDIIHAHAYTPYFYGLLASLYNRVCQKAYRPRVLVTEHGRRFFPDQKKIKRRLANPVLSLFTDEIITISESTKASLVTYENFPAHRITVIYNGIDLEHFSESQDILAKKRALGLALDFHVIGIVARLDPIKNHRMLLRAFQQVLDQLPSTYLLIVGDGPERQHLETYAKSLGIAHNTIFLGDRRDVPELLHIFDVFALSSFNEGMSVTLLEAMGAGLPIVATNVGGNPEVIQNEETGYLVQSDHAQEMAAMLINLLRNERIRQKMGQAGRQRVCTMFSLEKMLKTYTDLYFMVVSRHYQD